jgi:hypothetical protein
MVGRKFSTLILTPEHVQALDLYIEHILSDPDTFARLKVNSVVCREIFAGYSYKQIGIFLAQYRLLRNDRWLWTSIHGHHSGYAVDRKPELVQVDNEAVGVEA